MSEKTPLSHQFGRRNDTSNFKSLYLENLFSNMRLVSPGWSHIHFRAHRRYSPVVLLQLPVIVPQFMVWQHHPHWMITWPALCPAGSTFWNKTRKSQLPINRISSFFFVPYLLASLKAVECSTGPSIGPIHQNWILQVVGPVGRLVLPAVCWSSYH